MTVSMQFDECENDALHGHAGCCCIHGSGGGAWRCACFECWDLSSPRTSCGWPRLAAAGPPWTLATYDCQQDVVWGKREVRMVIEGCVYKMKKETIM
eukprot:COSAG01_NODE_49496_length_371_cov_2.683824_1_plen_97_part_00